jgi:ORF6N domain
MTALQPIIGSRILTLRDQRVMIDADLAELYGVQTKVLVQAVKRNLVRFPADFMFQLSAQEWEILRSQSVTSNAASPSGRGGRAPRHTPLLSRVWLCCRRYSAAPAPSL